MVERLIDEGTVASTDDALLVTNRYTWFEA